MTLAEAIEKKFGKEYELSQVQIRKIVAEMDKDRMRSAEIASLTYEGFELYLEAADPTYPFKVRRAS